ARMSLFEQLGNIGSEVGRTFSAKRRGDKLAANEALARAIDLFTATTSAKNKLGFPRSKEILRAKEEYLRAYYEGRDAPGIENYFMQFAVAARLNK
ncbi:MAG: hypothetical protein WD887_01745, partial [Candidatus Saccharimonadales bacterium]